MSAIRTGWTWEAPLPDPRAGVFMEVARTEGTFLVGATVVNGAIKEIRITSLKERVRWLLPPRKSGPAEGITFTKENIDDYR